LGTTGYINVHVSYKSITGVMNGVFSQKSRGSAQIYLLQSFEIDTEILNLRTSFEDKVLYNNLSMMEKHSDKKIRHGG